MSLHALSRERKNGGGESGFSSLPHKKIHPRKIIPLDKN